MNKEEFDYILELITHIKCNLSKGVKAPHKVVLLLSVIRLVERGIITTSRFPLSQELIKTFNELWDILNIDSLHLFSKNIWNPLNYMEDNIIRKIPKDSSLDKKYFQSIKAFNKYYEGLEFNTDFFCCLSDGSLRDNIKLKLISTHLNWLQTNGSIYKKILSPETFNSGELFKDLNNLASQNPNMTKLSLLNLCMNSLHKKYPTFSLYDWNKFMNIFRE